MKIEKPVLQVLQEARLLILDPANWIKGSFSTRDGKMCASEALHRAYGEASDTDRYQYLHSSAYNKVAEMMGVGYCGISGFNDSHTHAEVIDALNRAIAAEEKHQCV